MPYLADNLRLEVDIQCSMERTTSYLSSLTFEDFLGVLNYLNFKIVKRYITRWGKKYFRFAGIMGTLLCCLFEIYRRLIAPYEDETIKKNGDVD